MLNLQAVQQARDAIAGVALRSPMVAARGPAVAGIGLWFKLETLQPVGAFKIRGAASAIGRLDGDARKRGVVSCSTGNHGRAVAYCARQQGMAATICLSGLVPPNKVEAVAALGATVVRCGASQDDAQAEVDRRVAELGLAEIPPFDHPDVIAGQGTIALEILEDHPEIDTLLVPLSGGGLIGGVALAAKAVKPAIRVIGITMVRGAAMKASLAAGHPVDVEELPSLADSLGGGIGRGNRYTFDLCRRLVDDVVLLEEDEIYRGLAAMLLDQGIVCEGAGAVGLAAVLAGKVRLTGPTAVVVSGQNIDMAQLLAIARGEPVTVGDMVVRG
jgi:threonine dehydratase